MHDPDATEPRGHKTPEKAETSTRRRANIRRRRGLQLPSDRQLLDSADAAGIDLTVRSDVLSAAAWGLQDSLLDTPAWRLLCNGEPPAERARLLAPQVTDEEAEQIASWWWAEHLQQVDLHRWQLSDVEDPAELERLCQVVSRSSDRYGLPDDVLDRLEAVTVAQLWRLLDELLPAEACQPGAHLSDNVTREAVHAAAELLGDVDRVYRVGSAVIRAGELFDEDHGRTHRQQLSAGADRLSLTTWYVGGRQTVWLLALSGVDSGPLRPHLPLWRESLNALCDRARSCPVADQRRPDLQPPAGAAVDYDHQAFHWDARTLAAAHHEPHRLNGLQIDRLLASAELDRTSRAIQEAREAARGAAGEPARGARSGIPKVDLNLYV